MLLCRLKITRDETGRMKSRIVVDKEQEVVTGFADGIIEQSSLALMLLMRQKTGMAYGMNEFTLWRKV